MLQIEERKGNNMKRLVTFLVALIFILSSYSFAETFKNITYEIPKNHYVASIQNINEQALSLVSNDINSPNNIILQVTPSDKYIGYSDFSNSELKQYTTSLQKSFVDSVKNTPNSEIAKSWGLSEIEYSSEITAYKNSMKLLNCERVEITKNKAPAIKYIIYSEILTSPFIQTGYCIPNGNNYYYFTFSGNYTDKEINTFLNSIEIHNFVSKSDSFWDNSLVQAFIKGFLIALVLGFGQAIGALFKKKKQKSPLENEVEENPYIYNPNLSDPENLKAKFSQMNIETLKKLIDTQKDEYTEEAYNIALEQYKLRSADSQIPESKVQELQEQIKQLDNTLINLNKMLTQARKDLGNLTVDDAENMYRQNLISEQQKNEMINSIEVLQTAIEMTPQNILATEKIKAELEEELKKLQEV